MPVVDILFDLGESILFVFTTLYDFFTSYTLHLGDFLIGLVNWSPAMKTFFTHFDSIGLFNLIEYFVNKLGFDTDLTLLEFVLGPGLYIILILTLIKWFLDFIF